MEYTTANPYKKSCNDDHLERAMPHPAKVRKRWKIQKIYFNIERETTQKRKEDILICEASSGFKASGDL